MVLRLFTAVASVVETLYDATGHLFPSLCPDFTVVVWCWLWWEYLYPRNRRTLQPGWPHPRSQLLNTYQHTSVSTCTDRNLGFRNLIDSGGRWLGSREALRIGNLLGFTQTFLFPASWTLFYCVKIIFPPPCLHLEINLSGASSRQHVLHSAPWFHF